MLKTTAEGKKRYINKPAMKQVRTTTLTPRVPVFAVTTRFG
jgi:hypothetical protein